MGVRASLSGRLAVGNRAAIALSPAIVWLALSPIAFAAGNQDVTTTDTATWAAGRLPYATTFVGDGCNVTFQSGVKDKTIAFAGGYSLSGSVNFVNSSGGTVTITTGGSAFEVESADKTLSFNSGLVIQASSSSQPLSGISFSGSGAIRSLPCTISATSAGAACAAYGIDSLGELTRTISVHLNYDALLRSAYASQQLTGGLSIGF